MNGVRNATTNVCGNIATGLVSHHRQATYRARSGSGVVVCGNVRKGAIITEQSLNGGRQAVWRQAGESSIDFPD